GYGSRRSCEKLIADSHVKINGELAKLGDKGDILHDIIEVNGKQINIIKQDKIYIALNKPRRVLSEIKKLDDRTSVIDLINLNEYLFIIGRLDYMSEGLLLLTNDGELANKLTHPRYEHEKEYNVLIKSYPDEKQLKAWQRGVVLLNGYRTLPAKVSVVESRNYGTWLKIIMREGKKRQIREIGNLLGVPVKEIIRTRIATVNLENLKAGEWRYLSTQEIESLLKIAQIE
ncbi:MAG: rRNA pseudouridine synthase, partial [Candidatus Lokiarchaeota archaeon]|nr:rRNA pseudouridine synthase [Candidatus Lokiarchaeota archaeon]